MWQIFEFSTYEEFLLIEQFAIHFFGEQAIYFKKDILAK